MGKTIKNGFLDTNGDGTGTTNAVGDYSTVSDTFYCTPPDASTQYHLYRIIIEVRDSGSFDAQDYGNGIALTNGIRVRINDGAGGFNYIDGGLAIKNNADWARHAFDADVKAWGAGDEILLVRWSFDKGGSPVVLDFGESLEVVLNDSFTGLVEHTFHYQGIAVTGSDIWR